jgi:tetratricopeptide (TPR) repeat protein
MPRLLGLLAWGCALPCVASPSDDTPWRGLLAQAESLIQEGRYQEARRMSGEALRLAEKIEQSGPRVAVTLNQIGVLHSYLGNYSHAENAYLRGIRLLENGACEPLALS